MNDTVEAIYTQMFAPSPIPQSVINLYDRTCFLANRIDSPNIPISGLIIIAACATKGIKTSVSEPVIPEMVDMTETVPFQKDIGLETEPEKQTPPQRPDSSAGDEHGPMGVMDAPPGPEPQMQRGMSYKRLMKLSKDELRAHAKEFYGVEPKPSWGKKKIANTLKAMRPIKPGAVANKSGA